MCIISFQEEGNVRIPRRNVESMARSNSDGMGIMYPRHGKLQIWKTVDMTQLDELWNRYTTARDRGEPVGMHFRIRTHGDVSKENAHPFYVNPSDRTFGFAHNGSFNDLGTLPEGVSDTREFRDQVLRDLPGNFLSRPAIRSMIEDFSRGSKILFMDADGNHTIIHERLGYHEDKWDAWFSTRAYEARGSKSKSGASRTGYAAGRGSYRHGHGRTFGGEDDDGKRDERDSTGSSSSSNGEREILSSETEFGREYEYCSNCQHYVAHDPGDCPLLRLHSISDIPSELVTEGGVSWTELDAAEDDDYELMGEINWQACMYLGKIICWNCLPDDYNDDFVFLLPITDEAHYACTVCDAGLDSPQARDNE